jgi:threonine dehydratase
MINDDSDGEPVESYLHEEVLELDDAQLLHLLHDEMEYALDRIYTSEQGKTPCAAVDLESGCELLLKREDLSRVHSYKWRGATNKIASMYAAGFIGKLVAASAGNHAQGVALAAKALGLNATIFMPLSTPLLKQRAVKQFGGSFVEVRLRGDSFDESAAAAKQFAAENGGVIVQPYDDMQVIGGQATIGVELVEHIKSLDGAEPTHAFLEIGGGGMASGVGSVLRASFPNIKLIGVEAEHQNSMGVSVAAGSRQTLEEIDRFCDGTAVATPGELPFRFCSLLIDEFMTVTNDEVCQAIQFLWQKLRIIVEPSAGIGVAAARKYGLKESDQPLTVLSGSNVDFMSLPKIAKRGQTERPEERYFTFEISEKSGSLIGLLDQFFGNMNIIDFQYGKIANEKAFPVIGIEVPLSSVDELQKFLQSADVPPHKELTSSPFVDFRVIPFRADLLSHPFFAVVTFSNRPGALRDFMRGASEFAGVCYMNYTDSGQTEGQALMGFEFVELAKRDAFNDWLKETNAKFEPISMETVKQFLHTNGDKDSWKQVSADLKRPS